VTPLEIAEAIASQPTAPLLEHLPWRAAKRIAEDAGLTTVVDAVGNLVIGDGEELVLAAHLDHPAFVVDSIDGSHVALTFRGGVRAGVAVTGSPVLFHRRGDATPTGRGVLETVDEASRLAGAVATVADGTAEPDGFAVWDVTAYELIDDRITARACDDLLGVAAGLAALVAAGAARARLVCTRAEEIGLMGAAEAVRLGTIPAGAVVLSLECSKALPGAPQGGGVIVRVGDRSTVFDPRVSAAVWKRAGAVDGLVAQRRLMDGGSCEATVFCAEGLAAAGLALPLAGYHNQPDDLAVSGPVPESVLVADYEAEVALLTSLCADPPPLEPPGGDSLAELHAKAQETLATNPL
jgi:putative aminopeptidase FrvX